jgi:hypothetical protein
VDPKTGTTTWVGPAKGELEYWKRRTLASEAREAAHAVALERVERVA